MSVRETARALGVSVGVVSKTASRAHKAGITWAVAETMTDAALEERMYGRPATPSPWSHSRPASVTPSRAGCSRPADFSVRNADLAVHDARSRCSRSTATNSSTTTRWPVCGSTFTMRRSDRSRCRDIRRMAAKI